MPSCARLRRTWEVCAQGRGRNVTGSESTCEVPIQRGGATGKEGTQSKQRQLNIAFSERVLAPNQRMMQSRPDSRLGASQPCSHRPHP